MLHHVASEEKSCGAYGGLGVEGVGGVVGRVVGLCGGGAQGEEEKSCEGEECQEKGFGGGHDVCGVC